MPETTVQAPGTFCWLDLGTTDAAGAKKFYETVFGWVTEDLAMGESGTYTMIHVGDKELGGMYELRAEQRSQGAPPSWMGYVLVENADATVAKVSGLGGTVIMKPFDVMDKGRMAILRDPTGAVFAVWQDKSHGGSGMAAGPGTPCWYELVTKDTAAAGKFYRALFGWKLQERVMGSMNYTMFRVGEASAAGMMPTRPEYGDAPAHWMVYFEVEDLDASVATATSAGANVIVPRMEVEGVGQFSLMADPQGANLSLIQLSA
jgi:predicted enzyme related to lactoylglutathione lyase